MKEMYKKSLQMINIMDIRTSDEYKELVRNYLVLNLVSLQYMSGTKNFDKIIKLAKSTA